nr:hypothetical protein [Tanacetum cinerariifolium]
CKTRTFALGDKPHSFFAPEGKPPRRGLNSRPLACVIAAHVCGHLRIHLMADARLVRESRVEGLSLNASKVIQRPRKNIRSSGSISPVQSGLSVRFALYYAQPYHSTLTKEDEKSILSDLEESDEDADVKNGYDKTTTFVASKSLGNSMGGNT